MSPPFGICPDDGMADHRSIPPQFAELCWVKAAGMR